jgi:signal transduction histidine kinase
MPNGTALGNMKKDRLGLVMIAASLVVIGIISGLLYQHQMKLHREKTRVSGVALARALSVADLPQLLSTSDSRSLMNSLISVQANSDFAYGIVVDPMGRKLAEATSAGSIAPAVTMPAEPFAWFGEHQVLSPGDGRKIREFFAPVIHNGELAGFVRTGYYDEPAGLMSSEVSYLGLMALPIFLLTVLSYLLIRREIRPLGALSEKLQQAATSYGIQPVSTAPGLDVRDFIHRFDQFIQLVQSRVQQVDQDSVSRQATTHLLSYKQEKAESALNSIPEGILVIDDACVPTFANLKVEPILGTSREKILGQPPQEWCQHEDVLAFLLRFRSSPSAMRHATMDYMPDKHADRRIAVSAFPLFSPRDPNTLFGMLIVFRDISREYLARQAGVEFVAHVSHELKTPLNTLLAYSELLLDHATLPESDRVEAVNVIHSEVERMTGLINNLLNISKLETGVIKLARKRVKVQDLLQDSFNTMKNHARGKGIDLELQLAPELGSVRLDKELFRIAIDNLLSNAIKYSNPGGRVVLGARILDDEQMQILVRDQGIGISAEDRDKVFLKFFRASGDAMASRTGHGLGLYLARQIVELHHGELGITSEPGKGSEFTITFRPQPVQLEEGQNT